MKKYIWEKDFWYGLFRYYVDASVRTCYRKMQFNGLDKIPADGAVVFASNHCCTLMDPLVLLVKNHDPLSFGCRADVFRKEKVARLLRFLKMLPIPRPRDGMAAMASSNEVFDEIVDIIGHGVPFCIYPEGTHHPGYTVHPLKNGPARIALMASESLDKPAYIVPVGLCYSDFYEFMSDVTVNFGDPIPVHKDDQIQEITNILAGKMQELVHEPEAKPVIGKWWKAVLAVFSLPLFAVSAVASSPILLITALLSRNQQDRAWINTFRFGVRFFLFVLWPFHSLFYLLLNFYRRLFK